MKKCYCVWLCLLGFIPILQAQDIQPGEQAKGYLEGKNVSVDYSTGIFSYAVPLFELKSGNYTLPISLNYSGSGVKYDGKPGMIGHNWSLQCGGIVTRTIRGGIADEIYRVGIANPFSEDLALEEDVKRVNTHERDGESDVFTAVFNGQSVKFIITNKGYNQFVVQPLEKTGVKIDYKFVGGQFTEWSVTDGNGIHYVYDVPEWTKNYSRQEGISSNNIIDKSYISSWYLSRIDIPNVDTIRFTYDSRFGGQWGGNETQRNVNKYLEDNTLTYCYGRDMIEYPFNFSKYSTEYNRCINQAIYYIREEQSSLLQQYQTNLGKLEGAFEEYELSPIQLGIIDNYRFNERMLGILSDYSNVSSASSQVITSLNYLIQACTSTVAKAYLREAKEIIKTCLKESVGIHTKIVSSNAGYQIYPPVLSVVSNSTDIIRLYSSPIDNGYISSEAFYGLDSLVHLNCIARKVEAVALQRSRNLLKNVVRKGENGIPYQTQKFEYYLENENGLSVNHWGDYMSEEGPEWDIAFNGYYAQKNSLQSVVLPTGGRIEVGYEPNQYSMAGEGYGRLYSGLRVKQLVITDQNLSVDTIRYSYPLPGKSVYWKISSMDKLSYDGFVDTVKYSRNSCTGNYLLPGGNNGLYYPYVEEELVGKGKNTYLYSVPIRVDPVAGECSPFWLWGLPLAQAAYDKSGNLVQLKKNKYYADLIPLSSDGQPGIPFLLSDWCVPPPVEFKYSNSMLQVKANGFYADRESLDRYYQNQSKVTIFWDRENGEQFILNPYQIYKVNLEPRTTLQLINPVYNFSYGGRIALKEQKEYTFSGMISTSSSIYHLTEALPDGHRLVSDVEYVYDNPAHNISPTRVIERLSNGDERVMVQRRVNDFREDAHDMLKSMRQRNVIAPVIQEQVLLKECGETNYILQEETIHFYGLQQQDSLILLLKDMTYMANGENILVSMVNGQLASLNTADLSKYIETLHLEYEWLKNKYVPVRKYTISDTVQTNFDKGRTNPILTAGISGHLKGAAVDLFRSNQLYACFENAFEIYKKHKEWTACIEQFLKINTTIHITDYSPAFQEYYNSDSYQRILDFCRQYHYNDTSWFAQIDVFEKDISDYIKNLYRLELDPIYPYDDQLLFYNACRRLFYNVRHYPLFKQFWIFKIDLDVSGANVIRDLVVDVGATVRKYNLYYVVNPKQNNYCTPTCSILQANNQWTNYTLEMVQPMEGKWQLITYAIDLTNNPSVTSIDISLLCDVEAALAILVPADTPFEAVSVDSSGRIFCKLNHQGQLECYEYDPAGRVIKVTDARGNIVKRNSYKLINQ